MVKYWCGSQRNGFVQDCMWQLNENGGGEGGHALDKRKGTPTVTEKWGLCLARYWSGIQGSRLGQDCAWQVSKGGDSKGETYTGPKRRTLNHDKEVRFALVKILVQYPKKWVGSRLFWQ